MGLMDPAGMGDETCEKGNNGACFTMMNKRK
jgi:hypothetical protein